jgi:hypothetical protein
MSNRIPQEQGDASFDEKPPTRRDLPAEASKNATDEAEEIAETEALVVGLHEAPIKTHKSCDCKLAGRDGHDSCCFKRVICCQR